MRNVYAWEEEGEFALESWENLLFEAEEYWSLFDTVTAVHKHPAGQDCVLIPTEWPSWFMCRLSRVIGSPTGKAPYEWTGPLV